MLRELIPKYLFRLFTHLSLTWTSNSYMCIHYMRIGNRLTVMWSWRTRKLWRTVWVIKVRALSLSLSHTPCEAVSPWLSRGPPPSPSPPPPPPPWRNHINFVLVSCFWMPTNTYMYPRYTKYSFLSSYSMVWKTRLRTDRFIQCWNIIPISMWFLCIHNCIFVMTLNCCNYIIL